MAERLAPALDPLVGDDAQPDGVHSTGVDAAQHGGLAAHVVGDLGPIGFDSGDFHGRVSSRVRSILREGPRARQRRKIQPEVVFP
jgi:hypothetical protein